MEKQEKALRKKKEKIFNYKCIFTDEQNDYLRSIIPKKGIEKDDERERINRNETSRKLKLEDDIYTKGFMSFLLMNSVKTSNSILFKCFLSFMIQITMVVGLFYQYTNKGGASFYSTIESADTTTNAARILTCFLLHLQILPEVTSALQMLAFVKRHPTAFKEKRFTYPFLVCLLKLFGGYASMTANIFVVLHQPDIENVIKDYIAVNVINNIDNIMAGTVRMPNWITENELWINTDRDTVSDKELLALFSSTPPENEEFKKKWSHERHMGLVKELTDGQYYLLIFTMGLYRVLRAFTTLVYYYFAPFAVTAILIIQGSYYEDKMKWCETDGVCPAPAAK